MNHVVLRNRLCIIPIIAQPQSSPRSENRTAAMNGPIADPDFRSNKPNPTPAGDPTMAKHRLSHSCSLIRSSLRWDGDVVPSQSNHGRAFLCGMIRRYSRHTLSCQSSKLQLFPNLRCSRLETSKMAATGDIKYVRHPLVLIFEEDSIWTTYFFTAAIVLFGAAAIGIS
jgi:hypothetical protein